MAGKGHVVVDAVVDGFNAVGVVVGEDRVIWSLDVLVDDAIDDAQVDKLKLLAALCAVGNRLVLLVEVVEKSRAVVSYNRLSIPPDSLSSGPLPP